MARYAKPRAAAAPVKSGPRRRKGQSWEDQLFFSRLRRHVKWMFVLLAIVFAGGFVFFGVGSGSSGLGSLLSGNFSIFGGSGSSGPSVSAARKAVRQDPKDAQAWMKLATALQTQGHNDQAIAPLDRYLALRPKDTSALSTLAVLYLTKANTLAGQAQLAQAQAQGAPSPYPFGLDPATKLGQAIGPDPILEAQGTAATTSFSDLYVRMQTAYRQAAGVYRKLTTLQPHDASLQIQLGQAAESAGELATAIGAYKTFLKLAPQDPSAKIVKDRIKQLEAASSTGAGG